MAPDGNDEYRHQLREHFSSLPYNQLRKEAKANSISGKMKKVELVEALIRALSLQHSQEQGQNTGTGSAQSLEEIAGNDKIELDVGENPIRPDGAEENNDNDTANTSSETYTVEPKNDEDAHWISEDYTIEPQNYRGKGVNENSEFLSEDDNQNTHEHPKVDGELENVNNEESAMEVEVGEKILAVEVQQPQSEIGLESVSPNVSPNKAIRVTPSPLKSTTKLKSPIRKDNVAPSSSYERFALSHCRLFQRLPTLEEDQARIQQRHAEYNSNVPEHILRLASPKKARRPYLERTPTTEKQEVPKFEFGRGLPSGVIEFSNESAGGMLKKTTPTSAASAPRMNRYTPGADVKRRTMNTKTPNCTPKGNVIWGSRINQLAQPKGQKSSISDSEDGQCSSKSIGGGRSYTPHKGPFKYVDTTRMSNQEFAEYEKERKAQAAAAQRSSKEP